MGTSNHDDAPLHQPGRNQRRIQRWISRLARVTQDRGAQERKRIGRWENEGGSLTTPETKDQQKSTGEEGGDPASGAGRGSG